MPNKDIIERRAEKAKVRGRPFQKGNKNGNPPSDILDNKRHSTSATGGVVEKQELEQEAGVLGQLCDLVKDTTDTIIQDTIESKKELELLESIDFKNGKNTLSLRFSRRFNRMYRVQIFLNNTLEIRPATFSGSATGVSFWNLLKETFNK